MNILITGGAGFIGSALLRRFLKETQHNIVNIDKLTYSGNLSSIPKNLMRKNYFFFKKDINDPRVIKQIYKKYKPDLVFHLAAESHVDRSIVSSSNFIRTNIFGTYNLLEVTRDYLKSISNIKQEKFRFLHISTDEVYGDLKSSKKLFNENSPYKPSSPYSASKASSDHLVRSWIRTYDFPAIITNCSNNYGPYQYPEKLIPHVILNILKNKQIPVYGDGKQIRDWLYVDDHVDALIKISKIGRVGETYNIGSGKLKSNIKLIKQIYNIIDKEIPRKKDFKDYIKFVEDRPGHDRKYAIDSSKIKREINWIPNTNFSNGLKKTVCWFLKNKTWWTEILNNKYKLKRIN